MERCLHAVQSWLLLALLLLSHLGQHSCLRSQRKAPAKSVEALADIGETDPVSLSSRLSRLSQEQRIKAALPFSWVHVPKCGASIMNAVLHLPGVCPTFSKNVRDYLCSPLNPDCTAQFHGGRGRKGPPACVGLTRWAGHYGYNTEYLTGHKGHGLIMLRQPEQRLMSGYYNPGDHHGWSDSWGVPSSVKKYAEVVQGVSVKMLTRDLGHYWKGPPSEAETSKAVKRLRDGFAFVGISDEYELSVCLLHAMFGNECSMLEMQRWHPSGEKASHLSHADDTSQYDISELEGFKDVYDGAVFEEAMRIFRMNLRLYNVSKESCMPCFRQSGMNQKSMARIGAFNRSWSPSL